MSEPELEPFDFAAAGTTEQEQASLRERAKKQDRPPAALQAHELPDVFARADRQTKSLLTWLREWAVDRMVADNAGRGRDRATVYFDLWLEYQEAQANIDQSGIICLHPRTAIIIENPYIARRDKTRTALAQIRDFHADWLWDQRNVDRARAWLDHAQADRDKILSPAERQAKRKMEKGE